MCTSNSYETAGNRHANCQVGDLRPGARYRTPEGGCMLVLALPAGGDGKTWVADCATGTVMEVANSTRLGNDREGRLYASRFLNPAPAVEVPTLTNLDGAL